MILGMSIGAFTILHVIITLVAIGSGLIVVGGLFASHRLPVTTALFLFTTALTSVTGFLFPIHGFTPAFGVGILACVILLIALFALYKERLVGAWRWSTACGVVPVVTSRIDGRLYAVVSVNAFENVEPALLRRSPSTFEGENEQARLSRRKRNWIADVQFDPTS